MGIESRSARWPRATPNADRGRTVTVLAGRGFPPVAEPQSPLERAEQLAESLLPDRTSKRRMLVIDEIEFHLEPPAPVGHRRRGEPSAGEIKGDVPPVVDRWCQGETGLADDLEPAVKRGLGVLPLSERQ